MRQATNHSLPAGTMGAEDYADGELFEGLFGLNREADGDLGRTVENLKDLIAEQATELALGSWSGSQLNAAVAGVTFRTGDVGLSHAPGICRDRERFSSPTVCHNQLTNDSKTCPCAPWNYSSSTTSPSTSDTRRSIRPANSILWVAISIATRVAFTSCIKAWNT
jgi:hypothetical protein